MTKLIRRYRRRQEKINNKSVSTKAKNSFDLEPLEPRVLLSGDPVTVDIAKTISDENLYDSTSQNTTKTQEENIIDVANFTFDDTTFTVDENTVLKGSGTSEIDLINNNIVAPGYSPGVQNITGDYTQDENATLQIELGGTTAGTGDIYHDQLNISGTGNFAGTLDVSLWDSFVPQVGDTFDIITFETATGQFDTLTGFYGFNSDYYFDLVQTDNSIQLVTKEVLAGNDYSFISSDLDTKNDSLGMLLNQDYLGNSAPTSVTLSGNINLGNNLSLEGEVSYSLDTTYDSLELNDTTTVDVTTTTISANDLTAFFGVQDENGDFGLTFDDADFSIVMFDSVSSTDDRSWVVAEGTIDGESFLNLDELDFSSGNTSFYLSQGLGDGNTTVADFTSTLTVGDITFDDDGSDGEFLYLLTQNLSMSLDNSISLSSDNMLFGANSSSFYALSNNLTASMNTGAFSISVDNSTFGMISTVEGLALKADGDFALSGGGFSDISSTSSSLIYNNSNIAYDNYDLTIASNSKTLNAIEASNSLSKIRVVDFSATIDNIYTFSGDVEFSKNSSVIEFISSNANVALYAGNSFLGTKNANVGFSINNENKRILESRGDIDIDLTDDIDISASSSIVSLKDDGYTLDETNQTVNIGNSSFTFSDTLLGSSAISEVSLKQAGVEVDEFFYAKGDFTFNRSTQTIQDKDNLDVEVDVLNLSASNLEAFAGLNANTADATGLALVGANFALSIANERTTNTNKRVWTSLSASSNESYQMGFDDLGVSASDLAVEIDIASEAPLLASSKLSGNFNFNIDGFMSFDGDLELLKSNETFTLDDGSLVDVQTLNLSTTNTSAFIGLGGMGLDVSGMDLGLVYAVDSANPLRDWLSVKALADTSTLTGPFEASLENDDITLEINKQSYDEKVLDFSSTTYDIKTNTGTTITFDIDGSEGEILRAKIANAKLTVDNYLVVEGPLSLSKGKVITTDIHTGDLQKIVEQTSGMESLSNWDDSVMKDVELETLQIGGNSLTGFAGDIGNMGLQLNDIDFGVSLMKVNLSADNQYDFSDPATAELPIKFIAAKADVGIATLVGVDPSIADLDISDVEININTSHVKGLTAQAASLLRLPFADLSKTPQSIPLVNSLGGIDEYITLGYSEELIQAKIGFAHGTLANSIEVAGSMALTKRGTETVTLSDGTTTEVMSLTLGATDIYGFVGYSENGYLIDSNNDGIIDENDTFNDGVGLEISDMDLAAVFMRDVDLEALTYYTAVQTNLEEASLVGAGDNVTFEAKNLSYYLNTSTSSTVVDFSKSGENGSSYEIATGKVVSGVEQVITLDMNEAIEKAKGTAKLEVVGLLAVDGVFDFEITDSGLTAFFDGEATVGTDSTIKFSSNSTGLLVIAEGGIASRLKFDSSVDLGSAVESDVKFDLILNTLTSLNTDISYAVPDEFKSLVSYSTFTVPLIPPSEENTIGDYVYLEGSGKLTFLDSLDLDGDFSIVMSSSKAVLNVDASASVEALSSVDTVGTLGFEDGGIYGSLTFGSAGSEIINASAFSLAGTYLLQINTTSRTQNVKAVNIVDGTIDSTSPYTTTDINGNEIHIAGYSELSLTGAKLTGFMDMSVSASGIDSTVDMVMKLGNLGNIDVVGNASIGLEGSESYFAMKTNVDANIGVDVISIDADGLLEINTGSQSHAGVAGGQLFNLALDGTMNILGFNGITLKGDVSIVDSLFKIDIDQASLNFFNFVTFDMSGYIQSDGKYNITGKVEQNIDLSVIVLDSKMSLTLADTGFAFEAKGSVDIYIDFGLFEVDTTLAAVEGKGEVYASSALLAVKLKFMGIDFSSSASWSFGAPPKIASQSGDTLYLNMGQRGQDYRGDLYEKIINESYNIKEKDNGDIEVSSLGVTKTYSGVKNIVANGGDGNDIIIVDPSVGDDIKLTFDGEEGDDGFVIGGGAATSVITGGAGDDRFSSNASVDGIKYYGNAGNDEFVGSDANEFIEMGEGQNKITASGGDDTINVRGLDTVYGGGGSDTINVYANSKVYGGDGNDTITTSQDIEATIYGDGGNDKIYSYSDDTIHAGSGNDTIYIYDAGEIYGDSGDDKFIVDSFSTAFTTAVFGGTGNDTLELGTITSSSALKFGVDKFAYDQRVMSFDGTLERVNLVDNSLSTIIQNYSASSTYQWDNTSFALQSSGSIDVSAVTLNHKNALLSYKSDSIIGTLNTAVKDIAIVTSSNIIINEKDSLNIVSDNLTNGGLYTSNGKIDITLNANDSLLSLLSGILLTTSGDDIKIVADDIDFNSGRDMVRSSGALIIQAKSLDQNYRLGMAGSSKYGYDYSNDGANGYMEFTLKDFDALSSNFSNISIGHSDATMYIADIEDKTLVTEVNYSAKLNSDATFIANKMILQGDVQSSKDLTLNSSLLEVLSSNMHAQMGAPDSGFSATNLYLNIDEQMVLGGWLKAKDEIIINVTNSTGENTLITYGSVANSFSGDMGSSIIVENDNGNIEFNTSGSIYSASYMETKGTNSTISLNTTSGGIQLSEGGTIISKALNSEIEFNSASSMNLNSGATILAGADVSGDEVYKSAENGNITINAAGELGLTGGLTASGDIVLNATNSTSDHADYFDTINGKPLASTSSNVSTIMAGLENGTLNINLKNLFANNNLTIGDNASVTNIASFVPFSSLTDAQKEVVVQSLGYITLGENGETFYFNSETNSLKTTLTQGDAASDSTGYTYYSGTFYYNSDLEDIKTSITKTVEGDYVLDEIDWGSITKPSSGTSFEDMTQEQKDVLVDALGYTYDEQLDSYYNYNQVAEKKILTTFTEGIAGDYSFADITWEEGSEPLETTTFTNLTAEQKQLVLDTLGYKEYSNLYYNADAKDKFVQGFGNADYDNAAINWGSVEVPEINTSFENLSADQKNVVINSLGYTQYTGTHYYKADAVENKRLVSSFVSDVDYDSSIIELNSNQKVLRYIVTDGDNSYVVYGRDGDADGIANSVEIQEPHTLLGQRGYGFMLTGTLTSFKDNANIVIESNKDAIIRGNFNILGENSNLTVQSDTWTYWEGNANVTGDISVYGGVNLDGTINENAKERSLYLDVSAKLNTENEATTVTLKAGKDADINGRIVAGGTIGETGVVFNGNDGVVNIDAGEQIYINSSITASKEINIATSNSTSAEDNGYGLIVTTAGKLNAGALSSDNTGGNINIDTIGSISMMGEMTAGAQIVYTQNAADSFIWSTQHSEVVMKSGGQIYIGGIATTQDGDEVEVGGSILANHKIELTSGIGTNDVGIHLPGAARLVTHNLHGSIILDAKGDAKIYGKIVSGGEIVNSYDANGGLLGSTTNTFDGNSSISISAKKQIVLTQDLYAGKEITLSGGVASGTGTGLFEKYGTVVGGTVHLKTWMKNSVINISSLGDTIVTAPSWTQEIVADDFTQYANGKITKNVSLNLEVNLGTHTVRGLVTLNASATSNNSSFTDLVADLQNAIDRTNFKVISSPTGEPALGSTKTINSNSENKEVEVRLLNGKLMLSGNYETKLLQSGSVNADIIGFSQVNIADALATRSYTIDASKSGSVVNIGNITGNSGEIYIAGNIKAHSAINLYSGTNDDGSQNFTLGATGVLETLSGSVELNPGDYGVLTGTIIASGETSDIILNSKHSLDIKGNLKAGRDIIITAGSVEESGATSIETFGTSKLKSLSDEGTISITGLNDVIINSTIGGEDSPNLKLIELASTKGTLSLDKTSGRINTGASLVLSGQSVDLAGVITSSRATESTSDYEVEIKTSGDVDLHGSFDLAGSFLVDTKGDINIYNTTLSANENQRITLKAGGDFLIGTTNPIQGQESVNAVTISADKLLTLESGNLLYLASDAILETTKASSTIDINSKSMIVGGTIRALEDSSTINITTSSFLSLGANGLNEDLEIVAFGGNIIASGDVNIQVGSNSDNLGLAVSALSLIESLNADVIINSLGEVQNQGIIRALSENGDVIINSNSQIFNSNLIKATNSIDLDAGVHDSDFAIYLDDNSTITTTATNGTISLNATNSIYASGVLGESSVVDGDISATVANIDITSLKGDITIKGSVDAKDSITLKSLNTNVLYPGRLYTSADASTIKVETTNQIFTDTGALISSLGLTHLYGTNLKLSGTTESRGANSKVHLSSKTSNLIKGSVKADDIIITSGVQNTWSMNDIETSDAKVSNDYLSTLGTVSILESASIEAVNDITINAGGTVDLNASATAGDEVVLTLPVIQAKTVDVEVVTGYSQVDAGTVDVRISDWEPTIESVLVDTKKVSDGEEYFEMNVDLEQTGYYNMKTNTFKEYLIEGIDYFNENIDWNNASNEQYPERSATSVTGNYWESGYKTWGDLNDAQQQAVLNSTGYKKLYAFSADDVIKYTPAGQSNVNTEFPDWWNNSKEYKVIDIAGWRDKVVYLPQGADVDIKNVVSTSIPAYYLTGDTSANGANNGSWTTSGATGEYVGTFYDKADVLYTQDKSTYRDEGDFDDSAARWEVTYSDSGYRYFDIANQSTKYMSYIPKLGLDGQSVWASETYDEYWLNVPYKLDRATDDLFASDSWVDILKNDTVSLTLDKTTTHQDISVGQTSYVTGWELITRVDVDNDVPDNNLAGDWDAIAYNDADEILSLVVDDYKWKDMDIAPTDYKGTDIPEWSGSHNYNTDYLWDWANFIGYLGENDSYFSDSPDYEDVTRIYYDENGNTTTSSAYKPTWDNMNSWWNKYDEGVQIRLEYIDEIPEFANQDDGGYLAHLSDPDGLRVKFLGKETITNDITEDQHDYEYTWTGTSSEIYDQRAKLNYDLTTFGDTVWKDVEIYETTEKKVEVISWDTQTVWDTVAQTATQEQTYKERSELQGQAQTSSEYAGKTLSATNITINSLKDVNTSSWLEATSDLTINAEGSITVKGTVAQGADLASSSILKASNNLVLNSGENTTLSHSAVLEANKIDVVSLDNATINGQITSTTSFDVSATNNIDLAATINATNVNLDAGGTLDASLYADVSASDTITLSSVGNMSLSEASFDSVNLNLTSTSGNITHSGVITATTLTAAAKSGITANATVTNTSLTTTSRGDINLTSSKDIEITKISAANGNINITSFGEVTLKDVRTLGSTESNDLSVTTYVGDIIVEDIVLGNLGDATLNSIGAIDFTNASLTADELSIFAKNSIALANQTSVNSFSATTRDAGNVSFTQSASKELTLKNIQVAKGTLDIVNDNSIIVSNVQIIANEEASDINITSTAGDITLGYLSAGRYASNQTEFNAFGLGSETTITSMGDITLSAVDGSVSSLETTSVNLVADSLSITALSGISTIASVNNLSNIVTTSGDITITDKNGFGEISKVLSLGNISTAKANQDTVTITSDSTVKVDADSTLSGDIIKLISNEDDVIIVKPTGGSTNMDYGYGIGLSAINGTVSSYEFLDASGYLEYRAGEQFQFGYDGSQAYTQTLEGETPKTVDYSQALPDDLSVDTIIIQTGSSYALSASQSLTAKDKLELISSNGSVIINGTIDVQADDSDGKIDNLIVNAKNDILITNEGISAYTHNMKAGNDISMNYSNQDIYFSAGKIEAGNDMTFISDSNRFYANNTTILANGNISIQSNSNIYTSSSSLIKAVNLSAHANDYITLYTMVDTIDLNSKDTGNITVTEADALTINKAIANNGDITITSGDDMIATLVTTSIDADPNSNNISLKSYGDELTVGYIETATAELDNKQYGEVILESGGVIKDSAVDSTTDIYTKALTLKGDTVTDYILDVKYGYAGSDYTKTATTITPMTISNYTPLTPSYTLDSFPSGQEDENVSVQVDEVLTVNADITGSKDATFEGGQEVTLNGTINTTGDVAITGGALDIKNEITAGSLSITGESVDIKTTVSTIPLIDTSSGSGDVKVSQTGDIAITEIKLPSSGTSSVDITGTGNITIDKISGTAETVNITTTGDVIIKDVADVSKLNIITDGQIILGTSTTTINADELNLDVNGDVVIYEEDNVTIKNITQSDTNSKVEIHTGGKLVLEDDILITDSNSAVLDSGDDIVIKGNITVGSGDVVISTTGKLNFENDDAYDIVASDSKVTLDVAGDISDTQGYELDVDVSELDITSGSGNISINEKDDLILNVSDTSGDVNITTGGKIDITQITGSNAGNISIVSDDIEVNGKIQTANGDVILTSTNDIILHRSIYTTETGNIELTATKGKIANETNSDSTTTAIDTNVTVLDDLKTANYSADSIASAESTLVSDGIILSSNSGEVILKAYNEIGSNASEEGSIIIDATAMSAISNNKNDVSVTALKQVSIKQVKGDDSEATSITLKNLSGTQTISEDVDAKGGDITIVSDDVEITNTIKSNGGKLVFAPKDSNANLMLGTSVESEVLANDMYIDQGEIEKIEQISSITFGEDGGNYTVKMGDNDDTSNTEIRFDAPIIIINNGASGHTVVSDDIISSSSFTGYGSGHTTEISANQTYANDYYLSDSIIVQGDRTIDVTNGDITIDDTSSVQTVINGDGESGDDIFTLNASGDITLNAQIGGNSDDTSETVDALEGLNVTGENITFNESVTLDGDFIINSTGTVTFEKDVVINSGDLDILGATNVIFKGSVSVAGGDITLEANEVDIEDSFSGDGALIFKTVNDNLSINVATTTTSASLDLTQTELNYLADGFSKITFGSVDGTHAEATNNNIEVSAFDFSDSVELYGNNISVNEVISSTGNITFDAVDSVSIDANVSASGNMSIYTANGSVTQEANSLSATNLDITSNDGIIMSNVDVDTIDIDATSGTVDINFISDVTVENITTDSDILLTSSGNMTLSEDITSSSEVNIDIDGNFSMNDGVVLTTSGDEGFTTIDANGDIALSKLVSSNLTKVISDSGAISDNLTTGNNIDTTSLELKAATGIALDTSVDTIKLSNSTSGSVTINEADNISVDTSTFEGTTGEFDLNISGDINIIGSLTHASSTGGYTFTSEKITIDGTVYTQSGNIEITADEYTQNNDVTTDNGNIVLDIQNTVNQNADLIAINGDITVTSNSSDIVMGDGSVANLANSSGTITYNSNENIYLSQLITDGDISFSLNGFIKDISTSEEANIKVDDLTVTTQTGFGTLNEDIDLDVDNVTITNTTSGGIYIDEKDDLNIKTLTASNQNIYVNASGSIFDGTINESANIVSDSLTITSDKDIGTSSDELDLSVNILTNAQAQNIYISNDKSLNIQTLQANSIANLNINGSLTDTLSSEDINIKVDDLILTATTGIGSSSEDIDIDVVDATITNPTGGVYLDEKDSLNIKTITASNQDINIDTDGSLTIFSNDSLNLTQINSKGNVEVTVAFGNINVDRISANSQTVTLNSSNGSITDIRSDESANIIANTVNLNAKDNVGGANGADIDLDVTLLNGSIQNATKFAIEDMDSLAIGKINASNGEVTIVVAPTGNFYDYQNDTAGVNITANHLRLIGHGISSEDDFILEQAIETKAKTISLGSYVTDDAKLDLTVQEVNIAKIVESDNTWTQYINLGVFVPITTDVTPYASEAYAVGDINLIYVDYELLRYAMQKTYYMVTQQSLASSLNNGNLEISLPMIQGDILKISDSLYETFLTIGGQELFEELEDSEEEEKQFTLDAYVYENIEAPSLNSIPEFGGLTFDQTIIQENNVVVPFEYWIENITI